MSMNPGASARPRASSTSSGESVTSVTSAIVSSSTSTSPRRDGAPVPSRMRASRMSRRMGDASEGQDAVAADRLTATDLEAELLPLLYELDLQLIPRAERLEELEALDRARCGQRVPGEPGVPPDQRNELRNARNDGVS